MNDDPKFRFVDLFAGLGGFHQAALKHRGQCVFACEIDEELRELYERNFGVCPEGDIRKVDPDAVPDHELLCAGFPCQPFSKAGGQKGWADAVRGTVFWNIVEIARLRRPSVILLENVAHFVRHDRGNTYQKVQNALRSLGYYVEYRQYSPHHFGVPQIRERVYMVAVRENDPRVAWPEPNGGQPSIADILDEKPSAENRIDPRVENCIETWQLLLKQLPEDAKLPSFPIWSAEFGATYPVRCDALSRISIEELHASKGAFGRPLKGLSRKEIYAAVPPYARGSRGVFPGWKKRFISQNREFYAEHKETIDAWVPKVSNFPPSWQKFEWNCQGENRNIWQFILQFRASGLRVKRPTTSPSLVAMTTTQVPIIGWERRYMTVRECARLQSMGELVHLPTGASGMRALGNAVNVRVVSEILSCLQFLWSSERSNGD